MAEVEPDPYEAWLTVRGNYRRELFGEDVLPLLEPDTSQSLAKIARETDLRSAVSFRLLERRQQVGESVARILLLQEAATGLVQGASTSVKPLALFGLADHNELPRLTKVTTGVINLWERALTQGRLQPDQSPFVDLPPDPRPSDFRRKDVQLVVETAAAVSEVLQDGYVRYGGIKGQQTNFLIRFLAQQGPEYAKAWSRGDIIRRFCETNAYDAGIWLTNIPRRLRIRFALSNPKDPLAKARRFMEHRDTQTYEDWLEQRKHHREKMFGLSGSSQEDGTENTEQSLAAIALDTPLYGKQRWGQREIRRLLFSNTRLILRKLDIAGRNKLYMPTVVDILPEHISAITSLTAKVLWIWRTAAAQSRPGLVPLPYERLTSQQTRRVDFDNPEVQFVIETATAVAETLALGYGTGGKPQSSYNRITAAFIARRGPDYARRWLNQDAIRDYCARQNLNPDDWLDALYPRDLANLAINNQLDPIAEYGRIVRELQTTASTANIQKLTGWPPELILKGLPRKVRGQMIKSSHDTLQWITRVAQTYNTTLSTENLARQLNIPEKIANFYFPEYGRLRLARERQVVQKTKTILRVCRILREQYNLPPGLTVWLAHTHRAKALNRARQVERERVQKPNNISDGVWANAVARYPIPGDPRRTKEITKYQLLLQMWDTKYRTYSLDAPISSAGEASFVDLIPDSSTDPAELFIANEPGDALLTLAKRANIPPGQLQQLLDHFAETGELPGAGNLAVLFEQLKRTAEES